MDMSNNRPRDGLRHPAGEGGGGDTIGGEEELAEFMNMFYLTKVGRQNQGARLARASMRRRRCGGLLQPQEPLSGQVGGIQGQPPLPHPPAE